MAVKNKNSTKFCFIRKTTYLCTAIRRDGRVVDYNGLENRRTERYRGFESLSLRNDTENQYFTGLLPDFTL